MDVVIVVQFLIFLWTLSFFTVWIFLSLFSPSGSLSLICQVCFVLSLMCPVYFVLSLIVCPAWFISSYYWLSLSGLICPIADYPVRFVLSDSSRVSVLHGEYNGRTCIERQLGRLEMPYSQFCGGLCGGGSLAIWPGGRDVHWYDGCNRCCMCWNLAAWDWFINSCF